MPGEPDDAVVQYPGAVRARYRWAGSGHGAEVFALSEAGGTLADLGSHVSSEPDALCRAEVRVESPVATWTVRLASAIFDRPAGVLWDTAGLLVVKYGFQTYAFDARTGEPRWEHRSRTPILAVLASPRLAHVLVQTELETFALEADGTVAWRAAHSDVVAGVELVGGRLVLTSYAGLLMALDPATGRALS
ncbi:MAG TPA: PQQ-binding-like beta-propeller repeat protein [Candidatus Dormibacteraeota bacterium]|nr:PQQ-binding-like beta-propeller repeat protein [Candidatus Dormibacteraeota bacterium]